MSVGPGRESAPLSSVVISLAFVCTFLPSIAASAPAVDLHELNWYVHVDLIDAGVGEDLAYWQGVIDAAVASGNGLLEGGQGPFDQPCCTRLGRSVSVTTFGVTGDGLDVIDSPEDQAELVNEGGPGSNAFLVDSITYCGASAPGAIGCGIRLPCTGNGDDDPNAWMAVTVESLDAKTLPAVIAHERGHNACLPHIVTAECQLMQASVFTPGMGGCLSATECVTYQNGRTTTSSGLECGCFDNAGVIVADGSVCSEVENGICSGGLCGEFAGDASVHLIVAAAPGTSAGGPPDDSLRISALKGEWTTLAQFAPTSDDVRGLAYASDSSTLYGVVPTVFDDSIVTIDPVSGTIISFVGSIANGAAEIVSLAYDPGPTSAPGDDRLLVLEVASGFFGEVKSIDPALPSTTTSLGALMQNDPERFTGLAYDTNRDKLFAAKAGSTHLDSGGLYEVDLSSCPPSPCSSSFVSGTAFLREDVSLAFSPVTDMLYLVATAFSGDRTFYVVFDPATGSNIETLSLDVFTPAGIAALPEPGFELSVCIGVIGLMHAARRGGRTINSGRAC